jgi:hypothetical protein
MSVTVCRIDRRQRSAHLLEVLTVSHDGTVGDGEWYAREIRVTSAADCGLNDGPGRSGQRQHGEKRYSGSHLRLAQDHHRRVDLEFRHGTSIVGLGYVDGHRHGGWPAAGVLGPSGFYHSQTGLDWILSRRVLHPVRSSGYTMLVD